MGQTSDELRQEIDQHRQNAAEKIDALQGQVQGTADDLKHQAQDTVDQVKDTVQGTVDDAVEKIQEIDLEGMIRERPMVALGVGLIGGMVVGGMMRNGGGSGSSQRSNYKASSTSSGSNTDSGESLTDKMGDMTDTLKKMYHDSGLEDAINTAASSAMGALTAQITGVVERNLPGAQKSNDVRSGSGTTAPESTWPERS